MMQAVMQTVIKAAIMAIREGETPSNTIGLTPAMPENWWSSAKSPDKNTELFNFEIEFKKKLQNPR